MARLLYLAIDALGTDALEAHCPPNLSRLMAEGAWGELPSTIPPITPPAWYTIHTGANSGEHGVFGLFSLVDPGNYGPAEGKSYLAAIEHMRCLRFWERAALAGRRVVVRDMMMCLPRLETISDVGCVTVNYPWLLGGGLAEIAEDRRAEPWGRAWDSGFDEAMACLERKGPHYVELAADRSIDVLCLGLNELDPVQHHHGIGGSETGKALGAIDDIVGACISACDDDTGVIVVSDHGATSYDGEFSVPAFLEKRGLMVRRNGAIDFARSRVFPTGCGDLKRVDWEFGLYLNLRGRQARGVVPEDEADELTAYLARELREGFGFETVANADYYRGPHAHWGPDLLLHVPHRRFIPVSTYEKRAETTKRRLTNHSPEGVAIVRTADGWDAPRAQDEVAPLALRELGLPAEPMPQWVDGPTAPADYDEAAVLDRLRDLGYIE